MFRAIIYLVAIVIAEVTTILFQPVAGIASHTLVLVAVITDSALMKRHFQGRFILSLSVVPLIRIISLSLPLANIPQIWWYPIIYLPLLAATIVLARLLRYELHEIGIRLGYRSIPVHLVVAFAGIGFGIVEYLILTPEPLVSELSWQTALLPAVILFFSTGFVEEFIFRGVLQKSAVEAFGNWGIVYISFLFAILHIGFLSWVDVFFVFSIALFFGWVVKKTGSIFGVSLSHGITNIMLFVVVPFFF